jgi:hypothetical protein
MSSKTDYPNVLLIHSPCVHAIDHAQRRLDQAHSITAALSIQYSSACDDRGTTPADPIMLGVFDALADLIDDARGAVAEMEGQGPASGKEAAS